MEVVISMRLVLPSLPHETSFLFLSKKTLYRIPLTFQSLDHVMLTLVNDENS